MEIPTLIHPREKEKGVIVVIPGNKAITLSNTKWMEERGKILNWNAGILTLDAYSEHAQWKELGYKYTARHYDIQAIKEILGCRVMRFKDYRKYLGLYMEMYSTILLRSLGEVLNHQQKILEMFYHFETIPIEDIIKIVDYGK